MKKVMLLAAMLAMVLAAAVPAVAQTVGQVGSGNVACVQTAVQQEIGKQQIAVSQYGDATNINIQAIAQQCNVTVAQVNTVVTNITGATVTATASPSATASASASAPTAVQYQTASPSASPSASPAAELPPTGGSSLIALGAGVLLVAGGLLARRIVR